MKHLLATATLKWDKWMDCYGSWIKNTASADKCGSVKEGQTIVQAYNGFYREHPEADVITTVHDDLICLEPSWDLRILNEFSDPDVAIVGIAGATGHGDLRMYQTPYEASQLARRGFRSNLKDAEIHGQRFTGSCNVAVLDGMFLSFRRSFLLDMGGWPEDHSFSYFMYSEFACCMARRMKKKIRMVGIAADHLGGKSTGLKPDQKFDFEGEHFRLYYHFVDVLPWSVNP